MPTSLIAPAIGAGINFGASKLFGGKKGEAQAGLGSFAPTGINAGGLTSSIDANGNISVSPSAERLGLVRNLQDASGGQADLLAQLRASVAPGISELRASRLGEIENARQSAVGNLRDNLARRRVLGSSFGQDTITRAESEFGQQKERVAAESFLQELEASNQLINQEFTARRQQFQTGLDELNIEADLAGKLAGTASAQLGANARAMAELNAKEAAGAGKFFGETIQPFAKAAGSSFGNLFKSSGGGAASGYGNYTY